MNTQISRTYWNTCERHLEYSVSYFTVFNITLRFVYLQIGCGVFRSTLWYQECILYLKTSVINISRQYPILSIELQIPVTFSNIEFHQILPTFIITNRNISNYAGGEGGSWGNLKFKCPKGQTAVIAKKTNLHSFLWNDMLICYVVLCLAMFTI